MLLDRLDQANRQFRLQEAAGLCRALAEDYPGVLAWAAALDQYHAFLMARIPGHEQIGAPFRLMPRRTSHDARLTGELQRLNEEWKEASAETGALVVAYWSVANWDGARAAVWLIQSAISGGIYSQLPAHIQTGLHDIAAAFSASPSTGPRGKGCDLYVALQSVAEMLPKEESGPSIELADRFRWSALPEL